MSPNQSIETVHMVAQLECPYCRNIYDRNKLVFNSIISQYICLDCRQMLMDRSEQRRVIHEQDRDRQDRDRQEREDTIRIDIQEQDIQEQDIEGQEMQDTDENV